MAVVEHGDNASDDLLLRDEPQVTRVDRILLVDALQPVVVMVGTGLQSRNEQRTLVGSDGISWNGFAACQQDACPETEWQGGLIAGNGEGHDVASLHVLSPQPTIRQQTVAFDAQAIAAAVYQYLVAILIERCQSVAGNAMNRKGQSTDS